MDDPLNIGLRLALYLALMLLFGVALFALYGLTPGQRTDRTLLNTPRLLAASALLGLLLSLAALLHLAQVMSGVARVFELHPHLLRMLLLETDVGWSWMLRVAALALAGFAAWRISHAPTRNTWLAMLGGALALASLAWSGHGAMDEGPRRYLHLGSDILHLLGAGAWLGALLMFAGLAAKQAPDALRVQLLARTLKGFEHIGALLVVSLALSGLLNYLLIAGPSVALLSASTYGVLLSLKLLLFAALLVFAALNRWHLTPLLQRSIEAGDYRVAVNALRRSLLLELAGAVLIVALVAWLGLLNPQVEQANA